MKKGLAIVLFIAIVLSFCSCGTDTPSTLTTEAADTTASRTDEEVPKNEKIDFYAGYARDDISPSVFPIAMNSEKTATEIKDKIYATCTALSDGETTVLLMTLDIRQIPSAVFERMADLIGRDCGIPQENIFISATHNHSSPDPTTTKELNTEWISGCVSVVGKIAKEAIADLTLTEAYTGRADSEGLNFVRRYKLADGSYLSGGSTTQKILEHESTADTEIQLIRFVRENKKDILMVNWQAHAAHALSTHTNVITADFISNFRAGIEKEEDLLFAYYTGAGGNINLHSLVTGKEIKNSYSSVGKKMAQICIDALDTLEQVDLGKIKTIYSPFTAKVDTKRYYHAEALYKAKDFSESSLAKYGFVSKTDVVWTYMLSQYRSRGGTNGVLDIPLSAISIGDIGFVSAPYEMFDTNGVTVKSESPFKMTFVCAYTNGDYGYIPSNIAYPHGGYEVSSCCFVSGTGEELANKMVSMLKEIKN